MTRREWKEEAGAWAMRVDPSCDEFKYTHKEFKRLLEERGCEEHGVDE
jgi:hypothetical protein